MNSFRVQICSLADKWPEVHRMAGMGVGVISKARGTARFISRLVNRPLDVPATTPGGRFVANQSFGHVIALSGFCPRPDIRLTGRSRCPRGSGYTCYCLVYFLSVSRGFCFVFLRRLFVCSPGGAGRAWAGFLGFFVLENH